MNINLSIYNANSIINIMIIINQKMVLLH